MMHLRNARGCKGDGVDAREDGLGGEALGLKLGRDDALDFSKRDGLNTIKALLKLFHVCGGKQRWGAGNELAEFDVLP